MSYQEEDNIIKREFKHRNKRGIIQLLYNIQDKLTRDSGWFPTIDYIIYRATQLNLEIKWN